MPIIKQYVMPESMVFTDDFPSYIDLAHHKNEYVHQRINHSAGVYVVGDVHTQTIEGFWSLIKRGIGGVYHSVGRQYLQSYLDEYSFRYNRRHVGSGNCEPLIPEILSRSALEDETSSKFR